SRPDQIFGASLAEVVQLGCGTPPVVFELGNSCFGFLERIGLRFGTVALRSLLLLWLGTIALSGLLLWLDTVALGGLGLGHGGSACGELGVDHVVGVVAARLPRRTFPRAGGTPAL